jgi:hypothetical protein
MKINMAGEETFFLNAAGKAPLRQIALRFGLLVSSIVVEYRDNDEDRDIIKSDVDQRGEKVKEIHLSLPTDALDSAWSNEVSYLSDASLHCL